MAGLLRRLHGEIHLTSVFVTHDQEEAFEVADRVVIMNKGRIEQSGAPAEIFEQPANPFVMDFLGNVNVLRGHVQRGTFGVDQGTADVEFSVRLKRRQFPGLQDTGELKKLLGDTAKLSFHDVHQQALGLSVLDPVHQLAGLVIVTDRLG